MIFNAGTLIGILVFYVLMRRLCVMMLAEIARTSKEDADANDKLCRRWPPKRATEKPPT